MIKSQRCSAVLCEFFVICPRDSTNFRQIALFDTRDLSFLEFPIS